MNYLFKNKPFLVSKRIEHGLKQADPTRENIFIETSNLVKINHISKIDKGD